MSFATIFLGIAWGIGVARVARTDRARTVMFWTAIFGFCIFTFVPESVRIWLDNL